MGIDIISGFTLQGAEPLDEREGPFSTKAEALASIRPLQRFVGLQANIVDTSTQRLSVYKFDGGVADTDLVLAVSSSGLEKLANNVWRLMGEDPTKHRPTTSGIDMAYYVNGNSHSSIIGTTVGTAVGADACSHDGVSIGSSAYTSGGVAIGTGAFSMTSGIAIGGGATHKGSAGVSIGVASHVLSTGLGNVSIVGTTNNVGVPQIGANNENVLVIGNSIFVPDNLHTFAASSGQCVYIGNAPKTYAATSKFVIGIGNPSPGAPASGNKDGLIITDTSISAPEATISGTAAAGAKALITLEYAQHLIGVVTKVTTVADEAALVADKGAGNMHVYDKYIIATDRDGTSNVNIQIKFKSPDGNFFYEKIDNDGVIEVIKVI